MVIDIPARHCMEYVYMIVAYKVVYSRIKSPIDVCFAHFVIKSGGIELNDKIHTLSISCFLEKMNLHKKIYFLNSSLFSCSPRIFVPHRPFLHALAFWAVPAPKAPPGSAGRAGMSPGLLTMTLFFFLCSLFFFYLPHIRCTLFQIDTMKKEQQAPMCSGHQCVPI